MTSLLTCSRLSVAEIIDLWNVRMFQSYTHPPNQIFTYHCCFWQFINYILWHFSLNQKCVCNLSIANVVTEWLWLFARPVHKVPVTSLWIKKNETIIARSFIVITLCNLYSTFQLSLHQYWGTNCMRGVDQWRDREWGFLTLMMRPILGSHRELSTPT